MPRKKDVGVDLGLSDQEKKELHTIARTAIENRARNKSLQILAPSTDKLKENRGAFVCLYKKGMLRGCIGSLEADEPLHKTIEEMAQAAAFRDPRFAPVKEDELPFLDLEISVLTPLEHINDPEQIQVGLHGILIRKGMWSGLLLPQVATERSWDRITFLRETCRKAGLPPDAWKDKETRIYVFSADVF
ncbi:MAG TPA: AmmeMemoRadiSam system protein A [Desulfomonilaceae bacterium]|nr:AmmeMemoRadiSam system protein A [Desulfomonilaceae bacterium]